MSGDAGSIDENGTAASASGKLSTVARLAQRELVKSPHTTADRH